MDVCFRCGSTQSLYDAISNEGIVKVCERCLNRENLPVIKKVNLTEEGEEKRPTVKERLAYISGVKPEDRKSRKELFEKMKKQDEEIRKITEEKFREELKNTDLKPDISGDGGLVRNFHWIIMRARRARHLTQKQLADMIYEPEAAVRLAEKGMLPRERERIVKKLENVLKIKITNMPEVPKIAPENAELQNQETPEEGVTGEEEDLELDSEKERKWTIGELLGFKKRKKKSQDEEETDENSEEETED